MRHYIFSDEAGDFEFAKKHNVSRYFIACAVRMPSCDIGLDLLKLRRELVWDGYPVKDCFHASEDKQAVRDKVYSLIQSFDFTVYAQVLEKSKAQPQIRVTQHRFYQHAWYYLFKFAIPKIGLTKADELMVTTASVGTKKGQAVFSEAVNDVLQQTVRVDKENRRTFFCSATSDPCLQVADYCTWAIQRKWEKGDEKSYNLIKSKVAHEVDMWSHGSSHYY